MTWIYPVPKHWRIALLEELEFDLPVLGSTSRQRICLKLSFDFGFLLAGFWLLQRCFWLNRNPTQHASHHPFFLNKLKVRESQPKPSFATAIQGALGPQKPMEIRRFWTHPPKIWVSYNLLKRKETWLPMVRGAYKIQGGGFKYFLFSTLLGERWTHFDSYFFKWVDSTTNYSYFMVYRKTRSSSSETHCCQWC